MGGEGLKGVVAMAEVALGESIVIPLRDPPPPESLRQAPSGVEGCREALRE